MCLQFIAWGSPLLRQIGILRQAVSDFASTGSPLTEKDMVSEREIEHRCSSLIRRSKEGNSFEFAHFSVKEFLESTSILENPKLAGYHISKYKYTQLLAPQCLKIVHLSNDYEQKYGTPPEFLIGGPDRTNFYGYACTFWPQVIGEGLEDPDLVQISCSLISRKNVQSDLSDCWKRFFRRTLQDYFDDRYPFGIKYKAAREQFTTLGRPEKWFEDLHLAAALNMPNVCLSLLEAGANANHKCPYGTPIDLAMRGILAFMPWDPAWSEDEPQYTGYEKYFRYQTVIGKTVPAASQRNRTIEILIDAGSELSHERNPALDLGEESIFSTVAVIACHTQDFTPIIRLLSLGIVPSDSELDVLEGYLRYWIFRTGTEEDSQVRDRVLLELLEYMSSTSAFDSVWGIRMGSIVWSVASAVESIFTKKGYLGSIDTRISLSKDGLVHKAQAAISRDDSKTLKTCLDDKRLDASQVYVTEARGRMTLVRLATRYNAVECLKVLLDLGLDEDQDHTSDPRPLPLTHVCIDLKAIGSLRILVEHGISPLIVDSHGGTIFHRCAIGAGAFDVNYLRNVLELDPHATAAGLAMRTSRGDTPLDLFLLRNKGEREIEQMAFVLMEWCDRVPGFWSDHHQLFQKAAAFGSAPVIRRLLDLGVKPDPLESSKFLPLHSINANVTLDCVKLLKSLYGESVCELRAEPGKCLPVELYIMRCMQNATHPDEAIVRELLTSRVIAPQDPTVGTVWNFCCEAIPVMVPQWSRKATTAYLYGERRLMAQVPSMLLRLGCMRGYEEVYSQSALIPFFKGILDGLGSKWSNIIHYILPNEPGGLVQLVLDSTSYWDSAKTSPTIIRLLKEAIINGHNQLVSVLLHRGVNVHQRQDGTSAIEFICQNPRVMANNATTERKAMISEILSKTNHEDLNNVESSGNGLGLLHMVTSCAEPGPAWLMRELVKCGVDIEKGSVSRETPLLYHLRSKSFDSAQLLVELGASYGNRMDTNKQLDVIQRATSRGAIEFLRFLLTHAVNNSVDIAWDRPCEDTYDFDNYDITHQGVTALHLAAEGDGIECLQFFLDQELLKEFEPRTSHGWTPLHCAAWNDSHEAIELLISKGADVNALANDKSSPLHIAVREDRVTSTKTLIRLGAVSSRDSEAMTPKAYAIERGYTEVSTCLDEAFGPQTGPISETRPWHGMKPILERLQIAINRDDIDECEILQNLGCPLDTSMPKCHGCSPLIASIRANSTEVATWLLENGASTLKMGCVAHRGHVTEHATKTEGFADVLPQILERNHDEGGDLVFGDQYPLHHAVYNKNATAAEQILQHIECKKSDMG